jgi:chromodomain-helicase-DNA-binding protein 1
MIWFLLKPVRQNFERILSTTKENVKSSKERASIFGVELVVIGTFMDEKLAATAADEALKKNFWDFLAALWPVDDTSKSVTGKRLNDMYRTLYSRQKEAASGSKRTNGA